jgi:hypothetical protein
VIGDNVARAFSLVGALSIVRFRTVVRDTEDTAFVIFAVIVGMAVGGNNVPVAIAGFVAVTVAAVWMRPRRLEVTPAAEYTLSVRAGIGQDLAGLLGPALDAHTTDRRLLSVSTAKQGLSLHATYLVRLRPATPAENLLRAVNSTDGIQDVSLSVPREESDT